MLKRKIWSVLSSVGSYITYVAAVMLFVVAAVLTMIVISSPVILAYLAYDYYF